MSGGVLVTQIRSLPRALLQRAFEACRCHLASVMSGGDTPVSPAGSKPPGSVGKGVRQEDTCLGTSNFLWKNLHFFFF